MSDIRKKIQKSGRLLRLICIGGEIMMAVSMAVIAVMMIGLNKSEMLQEYAKDILLAEFQKNEFISVQITGTEDMPQNIMNLLLYSLATLHIILHFMLLLYLHNFSALLHGISKGEQPFETARAKKLRTISYFTILLAVFDLLYGIVIFLISRFLSYLFEYGAYLHEQASEKSRIQEEMILSFAEITENKSEQTGKHIRRVAEYSKVLAEEMGLSDEQIERVRLASTMHDVGKLLIPTEILEKPAKLTDEEFDTIKKHSEYGGMLLNSVEGEVMTLAKSIALEHHERIDGRGYPGGKHGTDIGIEGRIVAVADVYDALTSRRSYKQAWDEKDAYDEIIKGSGTQFDAGVVEAFKRSYEKINGIRQKFADPAVNDAVRSI